MVNPVVLTDYINKGFAIFPLRRGAKIPIDGTMTYKTATLDGQTILEWFSRHPNSNIGIQPGRSGMMVLDVDVKNGGLETLAQLEQTNGRITTRRAITGTGGYHYYFKIKDAVPNKIGLYPGIDIICDKNHVVAPPSVNAEGGIYRWDDENKAIEPPPPWLLAALKLTNPSIQPITTTVVSNQIHGNLALSTQIFLKEGAPNGKWNNSLFKAAKDYQEQNYTKEEFVAAAIKITGHLDSADYSTIDSAFNLAPRYQPRINTLEFGKDYRDIVLKCHLICSVKDNDKKIFVDLTIPKIYSNLGEPVLKQVFSNKELKDYLEARQVPATFIYNPRRSTLLYETPDGMEFNQYIPPEWLAEGFYKGEKVAFNDTLPKEYEDFFNHLCANHTESVQYLMDWISTSLVGRNYTLLAAIGDQGIGKGTLGTILEKLHGRSNYIKVRDTVFKEKFNAPLENRTLVHVDEIDLKSKEAVDRIKDTVNDTIEIERKGVDSYSTINYASFYLNSNSLDAIKIEPGDRRYSIIQLTTEKLLKPKDYYSALLSNENITKLAQFLVHREVKRDMKVPFRGTLRYEEVKEAGLTEWERWIIETLACEYKNKEVPLGEVQERVSAALNLKHSPGRNKVQQLCQKYPNILQFKRSDQRVTIRFL